MSKTNRSGRRAISRKKGKIGHFRLVLWISLVALAVLIAVLVYLLLKEDSKSEPAKKYQYVGANNCLVKVLPEKGEKGYDSQSVCETNSLVNDGWKSISAVGHSKKCINWQTKASCNEKDANCNCYQERECVKASGDGNKTRNLAGDKMSGKISDDDIFLTQYGCWKSNNKKKWKCDIRGNGCMYVDCDPGDTTCFDSELECLGACKSYCSEISGCLQTISCIKDPQGNNYYTVHNDGSINKNDQCFDSIKDCAKKCKDVKCKSSKFDPTNNLGYPKSCKFDICSPTDQKCLDSDVNKVFKKCIKGDCAPYTCNPMLKKCVVADGSTSVPPCDPNKSGNCYMGIKDCVKNCGGAKDSWYCDGYACQQSIGLSKKAKKAMCKSGNCYSSGELCNTQCNYLTKTKLGHSCWNGCNNKTTKCSRNDFWTGSGGGGPVCFDNKKDCKKACNGLKGKMTVFDPNTAACITLGKNSGCDLTGDSNCYQSATTCQYQNGLPFI